jgi:hypothetical protein
MGDTSLEVNQCDGGDATAVGLDGSEAPSVFSVEATAKESA